MRKVHCDHCGKEIFGFEINVITGEESIWDPDNKTYVGLYFVLCNECWDERRRLHIKLEYQFLHIDEEKR